MGCCHSDEVASQKNNVGGEANDEKEEKKNFKLLLLGAGGSGKSTVFRQVKILYGNGYDNDERLTLALTIHQNMVESMKAICREAPGLNSNNPMKATHELPPPAKIEEMSTVPEDAPFQNVIEIGQLIAELWSYESIKYTYSQRANFQLPTDIIHYFFNKAVEVMQPEYMPSNDDLLRCRIHSTGVKQELFKLSDSITFNLLDVGGQRNERKKWVRCFENVTAVLYVVALSEYDQLCYEDNETNRVLEALDLFEDITNSEWFAETPILLFLNKKDLLAEKIKTIPPQDFFPEYRGDGSYKSVITFLEKEFGERNQQDREIVSHVTCATNTNDVEKVFNDYVKDILRKKQNENLM